MTRTITLPEELRKPVAETASAWQQGMKLTLAEQLNELGVPLRHAIQIEISVLVAWAARIGAIGAIMVEGREPDRELWLQACGEDFDREVAHIRAQKAAEAAETGAAMNDQIRELDRWSPSSGSASQTCRSCPIFAIGRPGHRARAQSSRSSSIWPRPKTRGCSTTRIAHRSGSPRSARLRPPASSAHSKIGSRPLKRRSSRSRQVPNDRRCSSHCRPNPRRQLPCAA